MNDAVIALPNKPTCTPSEAARVLRVSDRHVRNLIADGTLLAINTARTAVEVSATREEKRNYWRVVVRATGASNLYSKKFLTLEELLRKSTNKKAT